MEPEDYVLEQGEDRVRRFLTKKTDHENGIRDNEQELMEYLFALRGKVTVDIMADWTGWSRQTLYNKWKKFGLDPED